MNENNKKAIKNAFKDLLRSMLPLVTTFLGVVLANLFDVDKTLTALGFASVGNILYFA